MITQWYDPEEGSAAVPGAISRALAAHGHEVHVLTGFPNYPTGRLYPGYRVRPYQYELRAGVHVHRTPLVPGHDRSAIRRAVNYLSFASSAALRLKILRAVSVWLVSASPATAALPAMTARALFGRPYVLLIQDLWPDTVVASGFVPNGAALRAVERGLHWFCRASYRYASTVAVTAPGMKRVLLDRGLADHKIAIAPNWVDESIFRPESKDPALARRLGMNGFVVMYAGSLGELQGLDTAIEAMTRLRDLPDVRLVMVGSGIGRERLESMTAQLGLASVTFLGQQPVELMPALMALSDIQLVSLRDLPLFHATLPSKVQAVLAAGRPVVASVPGDSRELIEASGAGIAVAPGDPGALAAAIRHLRSLDRTTREAMGLKGREFYHRNLSESVGSTNLVRLLEASAQAGGRPPRSAS
jgi:glycosyltransferase involved in cell wall biosynthesis